MSKKYHIITLGCQMNYSDSERIATVLESIGYKPAKNDGEADLVVINACSVRQHAIDRIWGLIDKVRTRKNKPVTILTGCVLPADKRKFAKVFDIVLDIKDLPKLPKLLGAKDKSIKNGYLEIIPKHQSPFSAFVPIMTGCNNFCSYCAVPFTRGREISRPAKEIICEIKNLIKRGYKEIWLLGQNVNSYKFTTQKQRSDNLKNVRASENEFAGLLKMMDRIPGKFWVRFTSPHPKDFSDELIKTMAECEKITPYLNLPVQAGDNKILKAMNRPYTVAQYKNLVKKIRKAIPDICLSTDVIVGFPCETRKQFENTAKLFREIKYDMAYISQYSPRPGTAAAKLKDNVPRKEKIRRAKKLNEILKKTAMEQNKKFIGKIVDVLVDGHEAGFAFGKSQHYKTVKFKSKTDLTRSFVKLKITGATPWGLSGKIYDK